MTAPTPAGRPADGSAGLPIDDPADVPRVLAVLRAELGPNLRGAWLHGSAVASRLRPRSDLDVLVLLNGPIPVATRPRLVARLMAISGWHAVDAQSRPLDLCFVVAAEVIPWRFPPVCELVYGEWLRADFLAQRIAPPGPNPDLAIQFSALARQSRALLGPPASSVFAPVPAADVRRAIAACLPELRRNLVGDERNVLLTLARMWVTLATREIRAKDEAAAWAMPRLGAPQAALLGLARAAYLGEQADDDWAARGPQAQDLADRLAALVRALT